MEENYFLEIINEIYPLIYAGITFSIAVGVAGYEEYILNSPKNREREKEIKENRALLKSLEGKVKN